MDGTLWQMDKAIKASKLEETVDDILNKNEEKGTSFDLCIYDGVLDKLPLCSSMLSTLNTAVTNSLIGKVVHVTSLAFALSTGGQLLDGTTGTIKRLSIDSWCEQNYKDAGRCEGFLLQMNHSGTNQLALDMAVLADAAVDDGDNDDDDDNDDNEDDDDDPTTRGALEVVKAKYFFAGGSAPFMFQFSLDELRGEIDMRMSNVAETDWKYIAQVSVALGTPSAVNTLMQQFGRICSPVSKYVLFHAYDKCKSELVKSVRAAAESSSNPTLKGWAFELEQIDLIRTSLESDTHLRKYVTNGKGMSFCPAVEINFDETNLSSGDIRDFTVI